MTWLPAEFTHPIWVPVCDGYHLRPITAAGLISVAHRVAGVRSFE